MHLGSSNIANKAFYESHGFVKVSSFLLGDTNPTWEEPPVEILVVSLLMLERNRAIDYSMF